MNLFSYFVIIITVDEMGSIRSVSREDEMRGDKWEVDEVGIH